MCDTLPSDASNERSFIFSKTSAVHSLRNTNTSTYQKKKTNKKPKKLKIQQRQHITKIRAAFVTPSRAITTERERERA